MTKYLNRFQMGKKCQDCKTKDNGVTHWTVIPKDSQAFGVSLCLDCVTKRQAKAEGK